MQTKSLSFTQAALNWLEVILEERFGYKFVLNYVCDRLILKPLDSIGHIEFDISEPAFYKKTGIDLSCLSWNAQEEGWVSVLDSHIPMPINSEKIQSPLIEKTSKGYTIHYDILGLTYWVLNRIEEIDRTDLDIHKRFPAVHSHAYKYGYLERPIVDEWLNILGQVIKKQWPFLELKKHRFSLKVSHDVDSPSLYTFKTWPMLIKVMAGNLLKRRDIKAMCIAPYIKLKGKQKLHPTDPCNTFDWLMDISEEHGLSSAFYFMCGRTNTNIDSDYEIEDPAIRTLMRKISDRGHEVGLHPSYNSFQSPKIIKREADRLRTVMAEEMIVQEKLGGRMHYLRWQHPTTLQAWNDASMDYDSTLSYADRPGFRCGTCFDFPAFNPVSQLALDIRIRPLIAMESSVISDAYLGLGQSQEALNKFLKLKKTCRKMNGTFTLLWHNSYFHNKELFSMYLTVISR